MTNVPLPTRRVTAPNDGKLRPVHKHRSYATLRAIGALILREVTTMKSGTSGGYLWSIAEPVGGVLILTLIFSLGFRTPPMGTNFAIFYATGVVPFTMYMAMSGRIANAITSTKSLLAYPAVTFVDALIARAFVISITQILIAALVFTGIVLGMETRTDPQIEGIVLSITMGLMLGLGVGVMNCFLFSAFPIWEQLWSIITKPLFLVSCIFFIFDEVPEPIQKYLWFNPLVHVVGEMRKSFYHSYVGEYVSPTYVFGVSLALIALGLGLLIRYHRDLQNS
ncbi:ABC transporter permease [Paracoccus caeni]|uniref:Transport permease protein n=1 Tax=Paracoccus caeni TaxID=657651 RepID=A0A934SFZ8_9RHOB|nr:ABC transporter permease [Paracoccus caeni]MBK4217182.1 ABC transporter permease [Paracoccus caeni]